MGKISEIFNFDNIGSKIKNLAKWSCWITILLTWIAAPIAFIVLVSDEWTAEFCWIPLVGAIIAPIFVWIGSWAMYAFGQLVEDNNNIAQDIHAIRSNIRQQEARRREAEEKTKLNVEAKAAEAANLKTETIQENKRKDIATFSQTENGTIVCSQCKFEQASSRKVCWRCGAKFIESPGFSCSN